FPRPRRTVPDGTSNSSFGMPASKFFPIVRISRELEQFVFVDVNFKRILRRCREQTPAGHSAPGRAAVRRAETGAFSGRALGQREKVALTRSGSGRNNVFRDSNQFRTCNRTR